MSDHSTPGDITLDELGIDLKEFFQKGDSSFDGLDTSCPGTNGQLNLDTKSIPNSWTISATDALPNQSSNPITKKPFEGIIADLSQAGKRNSTNDKKKKDTLDGWYGMQRQDPTPLERAEIRALQLKKYANPLTATSGRGGVPDKKIPQYYQFATEVGGGLKAVGEHTSVSGSFDGKRKQGRSVLDDMLEDEDIEAWTQRKSSSVHQKGHSTGKGAWKLREMEKEAKRKRRKLQK